MKANETNSSKENEMNYTPKRNYPVTKSCGCREWVELPIDVTADQYQAEQDKAKLTPCYKHSAKGRAAIAEAKRAAKFFDA
jgi:hypothetical protein